MQSRELQEMLRGLSLLLDAAEQQAGVEIDISRFNGKPLAFERGPLPGRTKDERDG